MAGVRPRAPAPILLAAASAGAIFVATPFVVPEVASGLRVPLGFAGLLSTAQMGGFALASLTAGRCLRPGGRVLRGSAWLLFAANAASAVVPGFWLLFAVRLAAGAAAGLMSWVAWSDVLTRPGRLGDVAAVGPVVGMAGAPLLGWAAQAAGYPGVYWVLAVLVLPVLLRPWRVPGAPPASPSPRAAAVDRGGRRVLAGLFLLALAGSSLFVYAAAIAAVAAGMSPFSIAWAFTLNSGAGLVATRLGWGGRRPELWLATGALSALAIALLGHPAAFHIAMAWWGFAFWVGIPEVLRRLAAGCGSPEEAIGRAQGLMALGRVAGPAVGGLLVGDARFAALGIFAAAGLAAASLLMRGYGSPSTARRAARAEAPVRARRGARG